MALGDHIFIPHSVYTHHGIDMGDGTVIQLSQAVGSVHRTTMEEFGRDREGWIREYESEDDPATIVIRAESSLGLQGYNLLYRNCEHFATWCKTGQADSAQVNSVARQLKSVAGKVEAKQSASWGVKLASRSLGKAATPWLLAADAAQIGTEIVLNKRGASPEEAQQTGRKVGLAASVGIGALAAGPIGAGVGLAAWAIGEAAGEMVSKNSETEDAEPETVTVEVIDEKAALEKQESNELPTNITTETNSQNLALEKKPSEELKPIDPKRDISHIKSIVEKTRDSSS